MRLLPLCALVLVAALLSACPDSPPTRSSSRTLTVVKSGEGGGTVRSEPEGLDCGTRCTAQFPHGTSVKLIAVAEAGSVFVGWTQDCSGSGECTLNLDVDRGVGAEFKKVVVAPTFDLTLTTSGTGSGVVSSTMPRAFDCESTCTENFPSGAEVTLAAAANAGSTFLGWGGACSGTGSCTVTLTGDVSISAGFELEPVLPTLSVSLAGTGAGAVTSSPAGIDCPSGACAATFSVGAAVSLTATPDGTSRFTGWSGACTGAGACTVEMSQSRSVTANFETCGATCGWAWASNAPVYDQGRAITGDANSVVTLVNGGTVQYDVTLDFGGGAITSQRADVFVVRHTPAGALQWVKRIGGSGYDVGYGVELDPSGNILAAGRFSATADFGGATRTSAGAGDAFLAKYSQAGDLLWLKTVGTATETEEITALAVAPNGDVVISLWNGGGGVTIDSTPVNGKVILARFAAADGALVFAKGISSSPSTLSVDSMVVDGAGNILLGGAFAGTQDLGGGSFSAAGSFDGFVAQFSATGTYQWARLFRGAQDEFGGHLALDASDNVYVVGYSSSPSLSIDTATHTSTHSHAEPWIAKFSSSGALDWSRRYAGNGTGEAWFDSVSIAPGGEVVVSGLIRGETTFDSFVRTRTFEFDLVLLRLTPAGAVTKVDQYANVYVGNVFVSPLGSLLLTGSNHGADFGVPPGPLPSTSSDDAYIAVLPL